MIEEILKVFPRVKRDWLEVALSVAPGYDIDTPPELASFLAQMFHESVMFNHLEENMNYSAILLAQTWTRFAENPTEPKAVRIPNALARQYEHKPVELANYIYAGRMGNTGPQDGWNYRGAGPMQITGRDNHKACSDYTGLDFIGNRGLFLHPETGIISACWFWKAKDLDKYDDDLSVTTETKLINGGFTGLPERQDYFNRLINIMQG